MVILLSRDDTDGCLALGAVFSSPFLWIYVMAAASFPSKLSTWLLFMFSPFLVPFFPRAIEFYLFLVVSPSHCRHVSSRPHFFPCMFLVCNVGFAYLVVM